MDKEFKTNLTLEDDKKKQITQYILKCCFSLPRINTMHKVQLSNLKTESKNS